MRKIFLTLLILLGTVFKIEAKEIYYSEYSEFSEYSLSPIESSELVNVEKERRHRFYEELEVGEYLSLLDDSSKFNRLNLDNSIDGNFSEWSEIQPQSLEYRIIESKKFYKVKKPKPINHISFMNTLNSTVKLENIEIYYLDEKLDYSLIYDGADQELNIYPWGTVTFDLKDYYDLQKITIKVENIEFNEASEIIVLASVPSNYNDYDINYYSYNLIAANSKNILIEANDWIRGNAEYQEEIVSEHQPINEPLSLISEVFMYRYQDPLFYFYNIERSYVDGYFTDYLGFIKDESQYQDYYRYQIRDKLEIDDEIVITSYEQKLSDFVISTSDYEIITDLDINQNGVYEVEFKTHFASVKKEIVVNIDKFDKLTNENNNLKLEITKLQNQNNNLKQEVDILVNKYSSLLNENYKTNCEVDIEEVSSGNVPKESHQQVNSSLLKINTSGEYLIKKDHYLYFSLLLLLLLFLLLLLLKKLSNENKF